MENEIAGFEFRFYNENGVLEHTTTDNEERIDYINDPIFTLPLIVETFYLGDLMLREFYHFPGGYRVETV